MKSIGGLFEFIFLGGELNQHKHVFILKIIFFLATLSLFKYFINNYKILL